jgi:hypothetical protein
MNILFNNEVLAASSLCTKGKFMLAVSVTLSKIFWPKRDEVTMDWRGLPNGELYDLYSSPNIAAVMKLRRTKLAGRVACMEKREVRSRFWWENLWEKDHLEDLGVGAGILRQIFSTQDG